MKLSRFESYLLGRPLSPGLCWQSGLARAYLVGNLVFKSERASAEFFLLGQGGGIDSGICFSRRYQDLLAIKISCGAYGSLRFLPPVATERSGACPWCFQVFSDLPMIFTFFFFSDISRFCTRVYINRKTAVRTLGKTIPYSLALGFCLPS